MYYQFKHMQDFIRFDVLAWMDGKKFKVLGIRPWAGNDGVVKGEKLDVVCIEDKCKGYKQYRNETTYFSAEYAKFTLNVAKVGSCKIGDFVTLVNPQATLYTFENKPNQYNVSFSGDDVQKVKV